MKMFSSLFLTQFIRNSRLGTSNSVVALSAGAPGSMHTHVHATPVPLARHRGDPVSPLSLS